MHVSPDPDLVTYWLADAIDARGYGLARRQLRGHGRARGRRPRDLVPARRPRPRDVPLRTELLQARRAADRRARRVVRGAGSGARGSCRWPTSRCAPTCARGGRWPLSGVHDRRAGAGPGRGGRVPRRRAARPTPDVLDALASAEAIVIGPSNPVASIGPILALPGMREALAARPAPWSRSARSSAGRAVKGPPSCSARGRDRALGQGVADHYGGLIDGARRRRAGRGHPGPSRSTPRWTTSPGGPGRRGRARPASSL